MTSNMSNSTFTQLFQVAFKELHWKKQNKNPNASGKIQAELGERTNYSDSWDTGGASVG